MERGVLVIETNFVRHYRRETADVGMIKPGELKDGQRVTDERRGRERERGGEGERERGGGKGREKERERERERERGRERGREKRWSINRDAVFCPCHRVEELEAENEKLKECNQPPRQAAPVSNPPTWSG